MKIIYECKVIDVPDDDFHKIISLPVHMYDRINSFAGNPELQALSYNKEIIKAVKYYRNRPTNNIVYVGLSEQVKEALDLPIQEIDNLKSRLEYVVGINKILTKFKTETLEKENTKITTRIKRILGMHKKLSNDFWYGVDRTGKLKIIPHINMMIDRSIYYENTNDLHLLNHNGIDYVRGNNAIKLCYQNNLAFLAKRLIQEGYTSK